MILPMVTLNLKTLIAASSADCMHTAADITRVPCRNSFSFDLQRCIIISAPVSQHRIPSAADCFRYSSEISESVFSTASRLISRTM
ncbi:MAG TPA: hypothetical protein DIV52_06765 [Ruminococcaceae bacterium]|nr:hypothetical protein [Oscillospiraceae bacterium]